MAIRSVMEFLEATGSDEALQAALVRALGIGDGNLSDANLDALEAEALLSHRAVAVCALALNHGFYFTVRELHAVIEAMQRLKAGELSEDQLVEILGLQRAPSAGARESVDRAYRGIRYSKANSGGAQRLDVLQFFERTADDAQVQAELQVLLATGDGDVSDFTALDEEELRALKTARGAVVADFAARLGYHFRLSELHALLDAYQRLQSGELSQAAFDSFVVSAARGSRSLPAIKAIAELTYKGASHQRVIPGIAQDNTLEVVRFMQKSHEDAALRARLQAIIGGDGDISAADELDSTEATNLLGQRSAQVVDLAAEWGFQFGAEDLSAVVGAFQLVEQGELSAESCNRILGISASTDGEAVDKAATTAKRVYRGVAF